MRNQQTAVIRENVFFPEIEPLSFQPSRYLEKAASAGEAAMCITATGRGPVQSCINHLQVRAVTESASRESQRLPHCAGDKSVLAKPAFVHDKKERSFKRHAGDLLLKAEHGLYVYEEKRLRSSSFTFRPSSSSTETGPSEKRVRSSSFSFLTAFPPHQPALNNNVFMPSTLLQERTHRNNIESEQRFHTWTVIKPATLPPPQVTVSPDFESAKNRTEEKLIPERKSNALVNNTGQPRSAHGSACILGMETRSRMQPFDRMPHKYTADFVFGENMEKRVKSPKRPTPCQTSVPPPCRRESTSTRLSYNRNWPYQKHRLHTTLVESAAAYTSRPRIKYELDQVEVVTGEESERNVLQISCKLFVFNKDNQVWTERGRGSLRLNDTAAIDNGPLQSRIVMRNHGNLKLILNTNIFNEMKLERANRRSLRITATDLTDNSVKIFLVQASAKDAGRLYAAIHHRLIAMRNYRAHEEQITGNTKDENRSCPQLLDSDSEEEDETVLYPSKTSAHLQLIRQRPVLYS